MMFLRKLALSLVVVCHLCSSDAEERRLGRIYCVGGRFNIGSYAPMREGDDKLISFTFNKLPGERDRMARFACKVRELKKLRLFEMKDIADGFFEDDRRAWRKVFQLIREEKELAVNYEDQLVYFGTVPQPKESLPMTIMRFISQKCGSRERDVVAFVFSEGHREYTYDEITWVLKAIGGLGYRMRCTMGVVAQGPVVARMVYHWCFLKDKSYEDCLDYYNSSRVIGEDQPVLFQLIYLREMGIARAINEKYEDIRIKPSYNTSFEDRQSKIFACLEENVGQPCQFCVGVPSAERAVRRAAVLNAVLGLIFDNHYVIEYDSQEDAFTYYDDRVLPTPPEGEHMESVFLKYLNSHMGVDVATLRTYLDGYVAYSSARMRLLKNALDIFDVVASHSSEERDMRRKAWIYIKNRPFVALDETLNVPGCYKLLPSDRQVLSIARDLYAKDIGGVRSRDTNPLLRDRIRERLVANGGCGPDVMWRIFFQNDNFCWDKLIEFIKPFIHSVAYDFRLKRFTWVDDPPMIRRFQPIMSANQRIFDLKKVLSKVDEPAILVTLLKEGYCVNLDDVCARVCAFVALGMLKKSCEPPYTGPDTTPSEVCFKLFQHLRDLMDYQVLVASPDLFYSIYADCGFGPECQKGFQFLAVSQAMKISEDPQFAVICPYACEVGTPKRKRPSNAEHPLAQKAPVICSLLGRNSAN